MYHTALAWALPCATALCVLLSVTDGAPELLPTADAGGRDG